MIEVEPSHTDLLERIATHAHSTYVAEAATGDPCAIIRLFRFPWRIDTLGEGITDGAQLRTVKDVVMTAQGMKRTFVDGIRIPWIDDEQTVSRRFLDGVRDQDGFRWDKLARAAQGLSHYYSCSSASNIRGQSTTNQQARASEIVLAATHAVAAAHQHLNQALSEALVSGRILVFEYRRGAWELRFPDEWVCPSSDNLGQRSA